ncbi:12862_t:CDS:2 [Funneliformis geosporum]|uniref:12862_t:CDS:1 n=1 Tax=Funneliformis geosporum TaxID=1117311 RepID=A0A9W4X045_9GLOM|nr:12862_t:CDS:2 [Funneliformis geosporum]
METIDHIDQNLSPSLFFIQNENRIVDINKSTNKENIPDLGLEGHLFSYGSHGQDDTSHQDAEKFLNEYELEKGFSIRRRRTESQISDNGNKMIQRVGWECSCADCKWWINGNFSKTTLMIFFTTVVNEHNHTMIPSPLTNIAKYRKLGEDMIQFIEFCVQHGITSAQNIGCLLREKFPGRKIHQKNLYNAIQAAKKKLVTRVEFDASDLMKHLYSQ